MALLLLLVVVGVVLVVSVGSNGPATNTPSTAGLGTPQQVLLGALTTSKRLGQWRSNLRSQSQTDRQSKVT